MITTSLDTPDVTKPILPLDQRVVLPEVTISRVCPTCDGAGWVWFWDDGHGEVLDDRGRCACLGCCWDHYTEVMEWT